MPNDTLRREIVIAAAVFAFGFFVLPLAIYWVGRELIGTYSTDPAAGALTWRKRLGLLGRYFTISQRANARCPLGGQHQSASSTSRQPSPPSQCRGPG